MLISALLASGLLTAPAVADDSGGDGTTVGGTVDSYLAVSLDDPAFHALSGKPTSTVNVVARLTATDPSASLTIADANPGPAHGHLVGARGHAAAPLEATVGASPWQQLTAPVDPLMRTFKDVVASLPTTISLRQRLTAAEARRGGLTITVLVTASAKAP